MTTREKRYALLDNARNYLDIAMRELTECIETYKKTAETFKQYRMNGDYVCKEFYVNGKFRTLESALDEMTAASSAVRSAENRIWDYKHMSDEEIETEYLLLELAQVI